MAGILAFGALSVATAGFAQAVQRWDYWGRGRPFPVYEVVWTKDDAVCQAIVKALNHPRPGDNNQLYAYDADRAQYNKPSLYRDPLFLRWTLHPLSEPLGVLPNDNPLRVSIEWMEVPFFNDGQPVVALRGTYPSGSAGEQNLYVIPDVEYFKTLTWKMEGEFLSNPRILRPIEPFMAESFGEMIELPKTMKDYEDWERSSIVDRQEFDIVDLDGRIYVTIRMPVFEQIVVLFFTARDNGHPLCLIGPRKPLKYR